MSFPAPRRTGDQTPLPRPKRVDQRLRPIGPSFQIYLPIHEQRRWHVAGDLGGLLCRAWGMVGGAIAGTDAPQNARAHQTYDGGTGSHRRGTMIASVSDFHDLPYQPHVIPAVS